MTRWGNKDVPTYEFGAYHNEEHPPRQQDWYRNEAEKLLRYSSPAFGAWDGTSPLIDELTWRLYVDHGATIVAAGDQWSHVYVHTQDKTLMFSTYSFEAALCKALMVLEGIYPMPEPTAETS